MAEIIPVVKDIELRINNPYSLSQILTYSTKESLLDSFNITYKKSPKDRYYQADDNESYSDISLKAYGDSKYWWVLYLTNYNISPELINPFHLPAGTFLLIPDLEIFRLQNNA